MSWRLRNRRYPVSLRSCTGAPPELRIPVLPFRDFWVLIKDNPHSVATLLACWRRGFRGSGLIHQALRIRRFMAKFLGLSFLSSASEKGRAWEHGPGTLYELLPSRSFSERLECLEKACRKRRFMSKFLGVFLFCSGGTKERTWEHKARTT